MNSPFFARLGRVWPRLAFLGAVSSITFCTAARADLPFGTSMVGVHQQNWQSIADYEAATLQSQNLKRSRITMSYSSDPAQLGELISKCEARGIKPMLMVEYYTHFGPLARNGQTIYDFWRSLGRDLATRYGTRISHYSAFNEPDLGLFWDGNQANFQDARGYIPPADYFQAVKGFADGVRSVNTSFKVIPGGFAGFNLHGDWTFKGYVPVLAPLLNDGTLDGLNIHSYNVDLSSLERQQQYQFSRVKQENGITRDINHYCTEWNSDRGPIGEKTFLTRLWDSMGVVGNGGNGSAPKTAISMPYTLFDTEINSSHGMAVSERPFVPSQRALTHKLVVDLTAGLSFHSLEPLETGLFSLVGNNKKMWVWQNLSATRNGRPIWSALAGNCLALGGIPSDATNVKIYRFNSTLAVPFRTIPTNGARALQLTDLPTEETLMFVADSANSSTFGELKFDFGTKDSVVAPGFINVQTRPYSRALGFGYTDASWVYGENRASGTTLHKSLHQTDATRTFAVDVPNGTYTVTAYLGDPDLSHTQTLWAEGTRRVTALSTAAGQISTQTFDVTVNDGQLSLQFEANGGTWACTGLEIRRAGFAGFRFDFNTPTSPTQAGWTPARAELFSVARGFGYNDISWLYSFDRATSGDLNRDGHTTDATRSFLVNVPNGNYTVRAHLGDPSDWGINMSLFAEGVRRVNGLTTSPGQISVQQFSTTISDGQLSLRFESPSGVWRCTGVEVLPATSGAQTTASGQTL